METLKRTSAIAALAMCGCAQIVGIEDWAPNGDGTTSSTTNSSSPSSSSSSSMSSAGGGGSGGQGGDMTSTSSMGGGGSSSSSSSSGGGGSGGGLPLCGAQTVPGSGWSVCWELNSTTLTPGKYATITFAVGQPALFGPSDPYTPGCISQEPGSANDTTDPSVLCNLGQVSGMTVYLALKSYDTNAGNPPLPFYAFRCDNQDLATAKCLGTLKFYFDGVLQFTFVDPPVVPFSYYDQNQPEPLQLKASL